MDLAGRNVLVVGLGRSGQAAANFLVTQGARVTITDQRGEEALEQEVAGLTVPCRLALGGHRGSDFRDSDLIVVSPGVPLELRQLQEADRGGVPIYAEVELAYRFLKGTIIGITGSNGKTTTTALIGEILRESSERPCLVAGNIGWPLTQCLLDEPELCASGEAIFVVELSSFQLETVSEFRSQVAGLLNVTPDHLDRHHDLEDYARAKSRVFLNQSGGDFAVVNADDPRCLQLSRESRARIFPFSRRQPLQAGAWVRDGEIRVDWDDHRQAILPVSSVGLKGLHNLENVLAAIGAGFLVGARVDDMAQAVAGFQGVEHRLELVRTLAGVRYYNDSKATNVDSASRAIEAFDEPLILILGGQDKESDFTPLRPLVAGGVKQLILLGSAAAKIDRAVGGAAPTNRVRDLIEAVDLAFRKAIAGDVVLLAPACTSFDMFENFEERGRIFKGLVGALPEMAGAAPRGISDG